jgi:ribosomal protein S12 methylthiotransferase accessory factor
MAVAFDSDPSRPQRLVGMGCDLSPATALDKAMFELCQARPSEAERFRRNPPEGRLKSYADVITIEDHTAFHGMSGNAHEMAFLWSTGERVQLSTMADPTAPEAAADLDLCVARLIETGHRVAFADITAPDVVSVGYRVVRSFATGLQPIHFGWGEARLGGRRLVEAPVDWGLRSAATDASQLNWCPHPLA